MLHSCYSCWFQIPGGRLWWFAPSHWRTMAICHERSHWHLCQGARAWNRSLALGNSGNGVKNPSLKSPVDKLEPISLHPLYFNVSPLCNKRSPMSLILQISSNIPVPWCNMISRWYPWFLISSDIHVLSCSNMFYLLAMTWCYDYLWLLYTALNHLWHCESRESTVSRLWGLFAHLLRLHTRPSPGAPRRRPRCPRRRKADRGPGGALKNGKVEARAFQGLCVYIYINI